MKNVDERLKEIVNKRIKKQIFMIILSFILIGEIIIIINSIGHECNNVGYAGMGDYEITAYNGKFEVYEGSNIRGINVKQLIKTTYQHNSQNMEDENKQVTIILKMPNNIEYDLVTKGKDNIKKNDASISNSNYYKVKCSYGNNGLVSSIIIEEDTK